jgi:phosphatidylinositol alpha-1,6-mannosyltransferase
VIIITTQCFYPKIGGIESLMTGMAKAMSINKKDVLVLADGPLEESDNLEGYKVKRFNSWKPIRRIQKANYIKSICKINNVEVIYADSWKSAEYLTFLNVPIFTLAHGTEIQKNFNILNIHKKYKQIRRIKSYNNTKKIIANSHYTKELLIESLSIDKNKIHVIHPGIDVYAEFINKASTIRINDLIKDKHPIILTLARIEARKGHKIVLEALSVLLKKYPSMLYIMAGDGPNKSVVQEYAKKLKISNNIHFLGWITEPEKSALLKITDLFVMTPHIDDESVEGFGMSFIDAAFHGVAVVGTDNGGIPDAIIDGKTGLIAKTSDVIDIRSKIDYLLSDKTKRLELGNAGKKNALSKYTWDKKVHEYLNLI